MPVVRYFLFAGGALLALLFLADWYWPAAPASAAGDDQVQPTSLDKEILRIRSAQKWPQKVVFDTGLPNPAPPAAVAIVPPPAPSIAAIPAAGKSALTAFAEMKPAAQPQIPTRKTARHRTSRPAPARVAADPPTPAWSWNW